MSTTLPIVIAMGTYAALPGFGIQGRIYFASDTKKIFYDTGTAWDDVTPSATISLTKVALAPSAGGNFTVAHGLSAPPSAVSFEPTSGGQIWLQNPTGYDAANLYLVASDGGVTANALCLH